MRYHCTHCGHHFESPEKEGIECPSCFWSTAIAPEGDKLGDSSERLKTNPSAGRILVGRVFWVLDALKPLLIALVLLGACFLAYKFLRLRFSETPAMDILAISSSEKKESGVEKAKKWVSKIVLKTENRATIEPLSETEVPPEPKPLLGGEDNVILARRIALDPKRELLDLEKKMLERRVSLRSAKVEKLPSPAWTQEQFEQMLKEQELYYKIPLPRSYRNKLKKVFREKYLAGSEAYSTGDLLQARNLWVEALAFPQYSENINLHRAVALTMLKPFINDTLSKIGALNGMLVESSLREVEAAVPAAYEKMNADLAQKNWQAAYETAQSLQSLAATLEEKAKSAPKVPDYLPGAAQVDAGIQSALTDLLEAAYPAVVDLSPLLADVSSKQRIAETFMPSLFQREFESYDRGLSLMDEGQWAQALTELESIHRPAILARDVEEKIQVIDKIRKAELAEPPVSS